MSRVGEFELIARLAPHLTGAGDDAAVLDWPGGEVVVAADALVQGRHWLDTLSSPEDVGWKALTVNLSDLAAMGDVRPRAAVIALLLPPGLEPDMITRLYDGMAQAAKGSGVALAGGDTTAADELALAVTVIGEARGKPVWRSGAQPGDAVVLAGQVGAAAAALALHRAGLPLPEPLRAAHCRPRALPAAGRILAEHGARALIDVSDGLGQDLAHICAASSVSAVVEAAALPLSDELRDAAALLGQDVLRFACGGGDDYALLAAVPAAQAEQAAREAAQAEGISAAVIGHIAPEDPQRPAVALRTNSDTHDISRWGWDHLEQERQ